MNNEKQPTPQIVRIKLMNAAKLYAPKIPDLLNQTTNNAPPMAKMAILAFRPFLPQLETTLYNLIENATDEQIFKLCEGLKGVHEWITNETDSESNPMNELH